MTSEQSGRRDATAALAGLYAPLAKELPPFLLACLLVLPVSCFFGASLGSLLSYLGYILVFQIVPGTLVYLSIAPTGLAGVAVIGWIVGLALEVTILDVLSRVQLTELFLAHPFIVVGLVSALRVRSVPDGVPPVVTVRYFSVPFLLILAAPLSIVAIGIFTREIDQHPIIQAIFANATRISFPPDYPQLEGTKLFYNYMIHTHIGWASTVTGVSTLELTSRVAPHFLMLLFTMSVYVFALREYRSKWIGVLVIMQVCAVVSFRDIVFSYFGSSIPLSGALVLSSLASYPVFLLLVSEALLLLRRGRTSVAQLMLVLLLLWSLGGLRGQGLVVFASGVAFVFGWRLLSADRRLLWPALLLGLACVAFLGSLIAFYGLFSEYSAAKNLVLVASPAESLRRLHSVSALQALGIPSYLAGLLAFAVLAFGQFTFLLAGIVWSVLGGKLQLGDIDGIWLGLLGAGSFFLYFTYAGGSSHLHFMHYAHLGMAFLGASGIQDFWRRRERSWRGAAVAGAFLVLAGLHLFDTAGGVARARGNLAFQPHPPQAVAGEDYRELIRHLSRDDDGAALYYASGPANVSLGILAEIPGTRLLGSRRALRMYLGRHDDPVLRARWSFIHRVDRLREEGRLTKTTLEETKKSHGIRMPLVVISAEDGSVVSGDAQGASFHAGRFRVFRLH